MLASLPHASPTCLLSSTKRDKVRAALAPLSLSRTSVTLQDHHHITHTNLQKSITHVGRLLVTLLITQLWKACPCPESFL